MADDEFAPITPGEMLKEELLAEYGLSQNRLALPTPPTPLGQGLEIGAFAALRHG